MGKKHLTYEQLQDAGILYSLNTDDIDGCIEGREDGAQITAEQREACHDAVANMDSSQIFEIVDVVIDCALRETRS